MRILQRTVKFTEMVTIQNAGEYDKQTRYACMKETAYRIRRVVRIEPPHPKMSKKGASKKRKTAQRAFFANVWVAF